MSTIDPSRLYTQLQNTGLANKDTPLYQLIRELIGTLSKINIDINGVMKTSGPGSSNAIVERAVIQQLMMDDSNSFGGSDNDLMNMMLGGPSSTSTGGIFVPYHIFPTETFTVPLYKQALFAMNIVNDGILIVDGFLIEVDRSGGGSGGSIGLTGPMGIPGMDGLDGDDKWLSPVTNSYDNWNSFATSVTGTQNNFAILKAAKFNLVIWSGPTDVTFTGVADGLVGTYITFKNASTGATMYFANIDGGSSPPNRFRNLVTSVNTPTAVGGWVTYIHNGNEWQLVAHEQGDYITVTYNSGNFTASSGTWTVDSGDQLAFQYWIKGRECWFNIDLTSTTNTGGQVTLRVTLTGMPVIAFNKFAVVWVSDSGVDVTTLVEASTSHPTQLHFYKFGGGNWNANTNTLRLTAAGSYAIT